MILVAVIIGYLLGIAPFIIPKIIERIDRKAEKAEEIEQKEKDEKEQIEILDEWLNGAKQGINEPRQVNQQEIFEEYMTGKVKGA